MTHSQLIARLEQLTGPDRDSVRLQAVKDYKRSIKDFWRTSDYEIERRAMLKAHGTSK